MSAPPRTRIGTLAVLSGLAFCVLGSYALARPASESLFLARYGSSRLPAAWLALPLLALAMVGGYNRLAARLPLLRLYLLALLGSGASLALLLCGLRVGLPGAVFALYLWKDIYIVLLVELFWSVANQLSSQAGARWSYGLYCFMGSLGGITGNLGGGALAHRLSTGGVPWLVLPALGAAALLLLPLRRIGGAALALPPTAKRAAPGWEGVQVLRRSAYLAPLLGMIVAVQVAITLIDFQFNRAIEHAYPDTDARTAVIGRVYAAIDGSSIGLQMLTGPLLQLFGLGRVLLGVPLVLGASVLGAAVVPGVALLMVTKVVGKSCDYSIFRAAKEILYIPLSYAEKTQGKALIDMLGYRMAKGGASLLLLGLAAAGLGRLVPALTLAIIGVWLWLCARILARHRRLTASPTESG